MLLAHRMRVRSVAVVIAGTVTLTVAIQGVPGSIPAVRVVVFERTPASQAAEDLVRRAGGTVDGELPLVGGFAATMPADRLAMLTPPWVAGIAPDVSFHLDGKRRPAAETAVKSAFVNAVDAPKAWSAGYKGSVGKNVAILDSGIAPVADLTSPSNRIVAWKDFVAGSSTPTDPHGHGTYIAGIVGGNGAASSGAWKGIAPGVGLVGIRVFDALGTAPASRIIQGIQWAIDHKATYGIRVLNMSFSTTAVSYLTDAVSYAAEQAWKAGIVVVASAGNAGPLPGTILSPGLDPYLITVGAVDDRGTSSRADDTLTDFSGRGPTLDGVSKPDLVAPGVWDAGLRVPLSTVDLTHPLSAHDGSYFDGSGTSPATAVVSGVVALMLQRRATLTPNQVKYVLKATTTAAPSRAANTVGAGYVNAYAATMSTATKKANGGLVPSVGGGLLNLLGIPDVKWR